MSNNKITNLAIGLAHIREIQNYNNNISTYQPDVSYLKLEGNLSVSYNLNLINAHNNSDFITLDKNQDISLQCDGSSSIKSNLNIEKQFYIGNNKDILVAKKYDKSISDSLLISDKRVGIGISNPTCILDIVDNKISLTGGVSESNKNSALKIPVGDNEERPYTGILSENKLPYAGFIRYNSHNKFFEGYASGTTG